MDLKSAVVDTNEDCAQNLAINLRLFLKSKNVSVAQLSQSLGVPTMTIRRLLSGETTDPRVSTLKSIADYFNVTVDLLMGNNAKVFLNSATANKPQFVPVLDWSTAEKISSIDEIDLNTWENWQTVNTTQQIIIGKNSFALESRPSMYPRYPQGTLFIIDPEVQPKDGDIVLVKIKQNHELTLRELSIDPPEWLLQPLVPGARVIPFYREQHHIVGINVLTIMYNRNTYS